MPFADINGQRLYYEDSGGDGPAVLFSHGFLMDHSMFDPQVSELAPEFRCITWDERGFGQTEFDGKPFTYWDSAADALALLDHLGVQEAVLAGMSQGGFLSLRAALTAPDRVRALVLIDTQAGREDPAVLDAYGGMIDTWTAGGERQELFDGIAALILGQGCDPEPWTRRWHAAPPENLRQPADCLLGREDLTDRLREITCPALVIHGTEDAAIALDRAEALCQGLPGCRGIVQVEGAGHAANLTHPELVNPALRAFLSDLAPAGAPAS